MDEESTIMVNNSDSRFYFPLCVTKWSVDWRACLSEQWFNHQAVYHGQSAETGHYYFQVSWSIVIIMIIRLISVQYSWCTWLINQWKDSFSWLHWYWSRVYIHLCYALSCSFHDLIYQSWWNILIIDIYWPIDVGFLSVMTIVSWWASWSISDG